MGLFDIFTKAKKPGQVDVRVPWVNVLGYEKTYGKTEQTRNQTQMVEEYKSWVYACATRNAYSVAKAKLRLYKRTNSAQGEELTEIFDHPFLDLKKNVNPFFNMFELWTLTTLFLELTGNAYWWIPKGSLGVPQAIWNIPANWVSIVPSEEKFISGYVVKVPDKGEPMPFDEEEIIHFKYPSPFDLFYGTPPLMGAQYAVDLNNHLKKWGINFFMNNAQPSGVLHTENALTNDQFQRLRDMWNRKYRGSSNAGKLAILEKGLKYQQIGSDLANMQLRDLNRDIRDEILACFGVPASKLGLVEDANRANAEANDYTYQKETVMPKLILMEEKLNEKFMPIYDETLVAKFDSTVPEDKEFRLKEQTEHIRSGYSAIDDERAKDDEDPYEVPETEHPLISFSVTPATGEPIEEPALPGNLPVNDEDGEDEEEPKKGRMTKATDHRTRKWNVFSNMAAPQERLFEKVMRKFFTEQMSEMFTNLNKFKSFKKGNTEEDLSSFVLFNLIAQNGKLKEVATPNITEAYRSGAALAAFEVGIDFELIEPLILRAVGPRIDFFAKAVNDATYLSIKDSIQEGIAEGESIDDIASRLDKISEFIKKHRSKRTAQTEVIGATNDGQLASYIEAGMTKKEWLTARDEKVRDSHAAADGQVVPITESFTTGIGSRLQYPGDRSSAAPAGDIINCRCTVLGLK